MTESGDREGKTEEPTEHRLRTAVEKGNIPLSREVATLGPLLGALVALLVLSQGSLVPLIGKFRAFLERPGDWSLEEAGDAQVLLSALGMQAGILLMPIVLILTALGLASSLVQNAPSIVTERITPQLSRISIAAGWRRIFGVKGLVEFAKAVVKLVVVGLVSLGYLKSLEHDVLAAMLAEPATLPGRLFSSTFEVFSIFVLTSVALAAADWLWVRFSWKRDLMMSRQELKDEIKQMDGDPLLKARMRSLARDRARRRMMAAVPKATLVIANPTHFAVALRYVRSEGGAPTVVAKGKDLVALRIREIAETHGIPVVEDKPLARSLYEKVEVDRMIPPEFYRAVAKIILFLGSRAKSASVR